MRGTTRRPPSGASTLLDVCNALGSGICWESFTVLWQKFANRYGGLLCREALLIFATLIMLPLTLLRDGGIVLDYNWQAWAGAIYLGVLLLRSRRYLLAYRAQACDAWPARLARLRLCATRARHLNHPA